MNISESQKPSATSNSSSNNAKSNRNSKIGNSQAAAAAAQSFVEAVEALDKFRESKFAKKRRFIAIFKLDIAQEHNGDSVPVCVCVFIILSKIN